MLATFESESSLRGIGCQLLLIHDVLSHNLPTSDIEKGLADPSLVADIMQRKYQLGEPLYRQEQYWKLRGIYLNRTSLANWVIKGAKWFDPVIRQLWEYAYLSQF